MTQSEQILEYIDGILEPEREQALFEALARQPELRSALRQFISIGDAVRADREAYAPPAQVERSLLAGLGLVEFAAAPRAVGLLGRLGIFGRKFGGTIAAFILGAMLTSLLFFFLEREGMVASTVPASGAGGTIARNGSGNSSSPADVVAQHGNASGTTGNVAGADAGNGTGANGGGALPQMSQGGATPSSAGGPAGSGSTSANNGGAGSATLSQNSRGSESLSAPRRNNDAAIGTSATARGSRNIAEGGETDRNAIDRNRVSRSRRERNEVDRTTTHRSSTIRRNSSELVENSSSRRSVPEEIDPIVTLQASINVTQVRPRGVALRQITPPSQELRPEHAPEGMPEISSTLDHPLGSDRRDGDGMIAEIRGQAGWSLNAGNAKKVGLDGREAFAGGFYYQLGPSVMIGAEGGLESYEQTLHYEGEDTIRIDQRPSYLWAGVALRYHLDMFSVADIRPFVQSSIGGTTAGPLARLRLGFQYDLGAHTSANLGGELSALLYNFRNQGHLSGRWGITAGVAYRIW